MEIFKKIKNFKIERMSSDAIWLIHIANPPFNLLTSALLDELNQILTKFTETKEARVMILAGDGERAFSAGADFKEIANIDSNETAMKLVQLGQGICNKIEAIDKPIIAAINGLCIGGANEIAMACHIRIASENAKISQPELNLGIIPGFGGTQRLSRLIGPSRARKLILTGDNITAVDAMRWGLVDEVVQKGHAILAGIELAKRIINKSQLGIEYCQRAIKEGLEDTLESGLKLEMEYFCQMCQANDMQEGINAFKEKRQPKFKGL